MQLQRGGPTEGVGRGGELCELEPGTGTPSTTPRAPTAEEEKVFPVQTTFNLPAEMPQENWGRQLSLYLITVFPLSRRTLVSSSLQAGSVSDIGRCASCRGENGSGLAQKAADGGRFEWFASVIMWPSVRERIGETCSEMPFYVNMPVLRRRLEHRNVIMHKASGGRPGRGGLGCHAAAQI